MQGLVLLGCLLSITPSVFLLECRDDNNNVVDWYVAYKTPLSLNYWYITSANVKWTKSAHTLDQRAGMIFNTLDQVYKKKVFAIFYNGQFSGATSAYQKILDNIANLGATKYGHMKGVVSMSHGQKGFWMIHSVPNFPPKASYSYPATGRRYAQKLFCLTIPYNQLAGVVQQLLVGLPAVYHYKGDAAVERDHPDVRKYLVVNKEKPGLKSIQGKVLTSAAGTQYLQITKSRKEKLDLYMAAATVMKTPLYVEAWRHGTGNLPSTNCSPGYKVENVERVKLGNVVFKTTTDHSKWAVSSLSSSPWVCIGDMNRQESQLTRGGGMICVKSATLWGVYYPLVAGYETCKKKSPPLVSLYKEREYYSETVEVHEEKKDDSE